MSYEVPHYPPESKRWPHGYSLLSLLFHAWVIWQGLTLLQDRKDYPFGDWFGDQQVVLVLSSFLTFACLLSLVLRTRAMEIVILNAIYSVCAIFSMLMHISIIADGSGGSPIFVGLDEAVGILVLLNAIYTLFRYLTRHER